MEEIKNTYKEPYSVDEQRKEEAMKQFRKSVLEVAEAFFAMSEEERKDMIEYAQERCNQAEEEYKKRTSKAKPKK